VRMSSGVVAEDPSSSDDAERNEESDVRGCSDAVAEPWA